MTADPLPPVPLPPVPLPPVPLPPVPLPPVPLPPVPPPPAPPLPPGVDPHRLRDVVAASRSWRAVLRAFGLASAHRRRQLQAWCEHEGVSTAHFTRRSYDDATLRAAADGAGSWAELLDRLGLAPASGSARGQVRKYCARLGVDVGHLDRRPPAPLPPSPRPEHLRGAGALLVAAAYALSGHRVSWPLEPAPYDLVVSAPGAPALKVQVKTTTRWAGGTWVCGLTRSEYRSGGSKRRTAYDPEDVDVFAVVDGDLSVYLVPAQTVAGMTGISLRRYERYRVPALDGTAVRRSGRADRI